MPLKAKQKAAPPSKKAEGDEIFDDFDAFTKLVQESFGSVAAKVAADNAKRNLPIYGAEDGKLVTRQPSGKRGPATSRGPG